MPYLPAALAADETPITQLPAEVLDQLEVIDQRTARILAGQQRAETRWKWQTVAAVAGAVFAAVKLGIVVFPKWQARRRVGSLGEGAPRF